MSFEQSVLSVLSGAVVGLSLGLLGGGGSILAVPFLLYVVRLKSPHVVIGTSALAVSANAFFNLLPHWRAGHVRWKPAFAFALPGILGAGLGAALGKRLHGTTLLFLFAILMFVIAVLMLRRSRRQEFGKEAAGADGSPRSSPPVSVPKTAGTGALVGALSGFFGIGGGFLIVPALLFASRVSFIEAIGTSLFAVGVFGVTTAVSYALAGLINWLALVEFLAGGSIGGIIGARIATRLSTRRAALNYVFSAVIFVVALYMLYKNATALHW